MNGHPSKRFEESSKLPPNDPKAERGVLGCILLEPGLFPKVQEHFAGAQPFFELPHAAIFEAFGRLAGNGTPLDLITINAELADMGVLDQVGGLAFVAGLADEVPSAANLEYYLEIVWGKHLARKLIRDNTAIAGEVMEANGVSEPLLARVERLREEFKQALQRGGDIQPQYLKRIGAFDEAIYARLLQQPGTEEPGVRLPVDLKWKVRRKELTLAAADNGAGKSTLLSWFALHMAQERAGICIASFEEPADVSGWRLASQLLGRKHLSETEQGRQTAIKAMAWLNQRFWFYDFLGISQWQAVLETFRYAAEKHGCWYFVLDSVFRIGIPDDDYAQQGHAAAAFAQFAMDFNAHVVLVIHENKDSKASGKKKIRGSGQWGDSASNIIQVRRNEAKGVKLAEIDADITSEQFSTTPDQDEIQKLKNDRFNAARLWDTQLVLQKQKYPGSQQNGSRYFWFDPENFQFRMHWDDPTVNLLEKWTAQGERSAPPLPGPLPHSANGGEGDEGAWPA